MHIDPTPEQGTAFAASADDSTPVFTLNLLRFSDAEAYGRYAAAVAPHLERAGWRDRLGRRVRHCADRAGGAEWDVAAGLADSRLIPCSPAEIG